MMVERRKPVGVVGEVGAEVVRVVRVGEAVGARVVGFKKSVFILLDETVFFVVVVCLIVVQLSSTTFTLCQVSKGVGALQSDGATKSSTTSTGDSLGDAGETA